MKHGILIGTMLAVSVASASAQSPTAMNREQFVVFEASDQGGTFSAQTVVESRVTTGRPYSADATTEFVQTLGDGNRINQKTTVRVFRDGDGRTRREEFGSGDAAKSITIYDPVANFTYVLDPSTRTARKSAVRIIYPASRKMAAEQAATAVGRQMEVEGVRRAATEQEAENKLEIEHRVRAGMTVAVAPVPMPAAGATASVRAFKAAPGSGTTESLGQQTIGGVLATGTRTTTVISAGKIGNEQEIRIVSEQWFSDELQALVMTRHSDPRSGETIYRLTNIVRAEPGAGLFDVPSDYTIMESSYMRTPSVR